MQFTRRDFLRSTSLFGGALFVSRGLLACAFDANRTSNDATGQSEDGLVTCQPAVIGTNHAAPREHTLVVSSADVRAAAEKTYSIKGHSDHDHTVTITPSQFAALAAGTSLVAVSSTVGSHSHTVTVRCASDVDASTGTDASASRCLNGAGATSISANHNHALVVPAADVTAATEKTYSIKGTSSHDHKVTITSAQFAELASGSSIVTVSLADGTSHRHSVTVSCSFLDTDT
jgi:hypothetical protein